MLDELKAMRKTNWHELDKPMYKKLFRHSAVERTKYQGLKRNIDFLNDETMKEDQT